MTDPQFEERMVRLRWACRRTLQMLDRPLGTFLKDCYSTLDMGEQFAFERLLNSRDQDILDWLIGNRQSNDAKVRAIIEKIRTHNDKTAGGTHNA
ncbi:MAG: succinate dehydrogenase assembly factor 2 [Thiothrix sp.]|jgi:succinate dehydrogenase flavin-adding protein (antitoxin of CptAB toxin-antitoxin module)|uniref:FAD assembly factor SdhE n=1 Tax=Thiothrix sp. TaxID=1032 RepID=UPI002616F921|nr:succinate dehydrogenase assembly factor 2 [Thiothrix sp.]MDD5394265.1 succinate dehydrogenase assembly factor 2 [Thiothrix sp.]